MLVFVAAPASLTNVPLLLNRLVVATALVMAPSKLFVIVPVLINVPLLKSIEPALQLMLPSLVSVLLNVLGKVAIDILAPVTIRNGEPSAPPFHCIVPLIVKVCVPAVVPVVFFIVRLEGIFM